MVNHSFMTKSCYQFLRDGGTRSKVADSIWKSKILLKFKGFSWIVVHDKILTNANLVKKRWTGLTSCCFCKSSMEDSINLFLTCPKILAVSCFFINTNQVDNHDIG